MTFIARELTKEEKCMINLGAQGIPQERIPQDWPYAVDEGRNALFTQLLGNTGEMRDGYYYYVLLWQGKSSVFLRSEGRLKLSQDISSTPHLPSDRSSIESMANDALVALDGRNKSYSAIISS